MCFDVVFMGCHLLYCYRKWMPSICRAYPIRQSAMIVLMGSMWNINFSINPNMVPIIDHMRKKISNSIMTAPFFNPYRSWKQTARWWLQVRPGRQPPVYLWSVLVCTPSCVCSFPGCCSWQMQNKPVYVILIITWFTQTNETQGTINTGYHKQKGV